MRVVARRAARAGRAWAAPWAPLPISPSPAATTAPNHPHPASTLTTCASRAPNAHTRMTSTIVRNDCSSGPPPQITRPDGMVMEGWGGGGRRAGAPRLWVCRARRPSRSLRLPPRTPKRAPRPLPQRLLPRRAHPTHTERAVEGASCAPCGPGAAARRWACEASACPRRQGRGRRARCSKGAVDVVLCHGAMRGGGNGRRGAPGARAWSLSRRAAGAHPPPASPARMPQGQNINRDRDTGDSGGGRRLDRQQPRRDGRGGAVARDRPGRRGGAPGGGRGRARGGAPAPPPPRGPGRGGGGGGGLGRRAEEEEGDERRGRERSLSFKR